MPLAYYATIDGAIAACETPGTARKAEDRGLVQVSGALHKVLWQRKDRAAYARLAWATLPQARAVGGWRPSGVLARHGAGCACAACAMRAAIDNW